MTLEEKIRLYEAADIDPDPGIAHPFLFIAALCIGAWAAAGGIGYCLYRAISALAG